MDTSETYFKMRLAAAQWLGMGCRPETDIMANAGRDLSLGSPLILRVETYKRISGDVWLDLKGDYYYDSGVGACQLERQDQLQEMLEFPVGSFNDNFWDALADLYNWSFKGSWRKFEHYIPLSMEQLWLAFVMKEKYDKVWNGEDWIKW